MNAYSNGELQARRTLRRLLATCHRDLAFYGYSLERIGDTELSAAIEHVMQVRMHLVAALSHYPGGDTSAAQAERMGALRGWEVAMRTRLSRLGETAYVEELERVESELLEQFEDATLDPRLSAGMRITLERHLALLHSAHDRAATTATRIRSRTKPEHGSRRAVSAGRQQELDASMNRALALFFYRS